MEEYIVYLAVFIVGTLVGWQFREITAVMRVKRMLKAYQEDVKRIQEVEDSERMRVTIEKEQDTYYVYDMSGTFLVQATNQKELEQALLDKFPGKTFAVTPENLKEVGLKC